MWFQGLLHRMGNEEAIQFLPLYMERASALNAEKERLTGIGWRSSSDMDGVADDFIPIYQFICALCNLSLEQEQEEREKVLWKSTR